MPIKKIVTNALEDNAITTDKTVTAISNFLVPAGAIIMWSGASIPNGWQLCDDSAEAVAAGCPNLTDKFIIGAGNTYTLDAEGGSANAVLIAHNHTYTNRTNTSGNNSVTGGPSSINDGALPNQATSTTGVNASGGSSNTQTGVNANLPPYYALAFIMKLA